MSNVNILKQEARRYFSLHLLKLYKKREAIKTGTKQYKTDYATLTVEKCFGNHYVVPEYQREYVWENTDIEQLLSDLIAAYERNSQKPYFMGMIVVCAEEDSSLELVDGQQRITTFFLLLSAISHLYKENHDSSGKAFEEKIHNLHMNDNGDAEDRYALELQYETSSDCLNKVFHQSIPNELEIETCTISDQRLYRAYSAIIQILKQEFTDFSELKKFAAYVLKKVEFVQVQTTDISDALKIFETINERGVGLSPMDLLKNMVFMNVEKGKFAALNQEWKKLITNLENAGEKPLRFLRYFITATYNIIDSDSATPGILPEDSIYKWLTENDSQCKYSSAPFEFVELLNKSAERYIGFLNPNSTDPGNEFLRNIPRAAGTPYRLHLVLLMAASKMDVNTLGKFKQVLESVVYYLAVNSIKANETEKIFAAWCPKIRGIATLEDLKELVCTTIVPQVNRWKLAHRQNFLMINLSTMQKYRIKYILTRITKYVDDVRGGGTQYANIDAYYDKKIQIEHIMPQACEDYSAYGLLEEEFSTYIGRLGNLTLLEKTYNGSCQTQAYAKKVVTYASSQFYLTKALSKLEDVGVDTAANKLNAILASWAEWNKESIDQRQEILYKLSEMIWSIDSYINEWK